MRWLKTGGCVNTTKREARKEDRTRPRSDLWGGPQEHAGHEIQSGFRPISVTSIGCKLDRNKDIVTLSTKCQISHRTNDSNLVAPCIQEALTSKIYVFIINIIIAMCQRGAHTLITFRKRFETKKKKKQLFQEVCLTLEDWSKTGL